MSELEKRLGLDGLRRQVVEESWANLLRLLFGVSGETAAVMRDMILSDNPEMVLPPAHWWDPSEDNPALALRGGYKTLGTDLLFRRPGPDARQPSIRPLNDVQLAAYRQGRIVCPHGAADGVMLPTSEIPQNLAMPKTWRGRGTEFSRHTIELIELEPTVWRIEEFTTTDDDSNLPVLVIPAVSEHFDAVGIDAFQCNHPTNDRWWMTKLVTEYT